MNLTCVGKSLSTQPKKTRQDPTDTALPASTEQCQHGQERGLPVRHLDFCSLCRSVPIDTALAVSTEQCQQSCLSEGRYNYFRLCRQDPIDTVVAVSIGG